MAASVASPNSVQRKRLTIHETFEALRARRRIALLPFVPAGYPDLQTTAAALPALEEGGASLIEVGIPFSDPIADGPTIQEAFTAALSKHLKVDEVFAAVASARDRVSLPLVSMVSYSVVFRYGLGRFVAAAKSAGFDGLILPDLPPPEAQRICKQVRSGGLETILLVAPTTTPQRRQEIAELCSGFVYYLSVSGITGERDQLPADLFENAQQLKELTDKPICVGFGISKPRHLAELNGRVDGAIIGTGVVKRMKPLLTAGPARIADELRRYAREMLSELPA